MSGAIAGTAILKNMSETDKLEIVTMTINNECNMHCPHCYMQYDKESYMINDDTLKSVFNSSFNHLAIVGREPLINEESIRVLEKIAKMCSENDKSISMVTNGSRLLDCDLELIKYFDFIDVSFDGGVRRYNDYRKGDFIKIINGVKKINDAGVSVNA
ncbi:MAG: radical SAM protein, partial [Chlorobium sp.]